MSERLHQASETATALRSGFDRSFAEPHEAREGAFEYFLAIQVAGLPRAMSLSDIAGLYSDRRIVMIPGSARELLGIANVRNAIVPIYSLGALLGFHGGSTSRWIVLVRAPEPVGFAFERLESTLHVPSERVTPDAELGAGGPSRGVVRMDPIRPIVNVASALEVIRRLVALCQAELIRSGVEP